MHAGGHNIHSNMNMTDLILRNNRRTGQKPNGVFFTHVMKNGGSTLHDLFRRYQLNNPAIKYFGPESNMIEPKIAIYGGGVKIPWNINNVLSIVVIRKPIDRVISHYYQVKPWGTHRGADRVCANAAELGYLSYLQKCRFATNWQSTYLRGKIEEYISDFSMVVPMENYSEAMVILHRYGGFNVSDVLFIVMKNWTTDSSYPIGDVSSKTISGQNLTLTVNLNKKDESLYKTAKRRWKYMTLPLVPDTLFREEVANYTLLLHHFQKEFDGYRKTLSLVDPKRPGIPVTVMVQNNYIKKYCQNSMQCCLHNNLNCFDMDGNKK